MAQNAEDERDDLEDSIAEWESEDPSIRERIAIVLKRIEKERGTMNPFSDKRPYFGQDPFIVEYEGSLLLIESEDDKLIVIKEFKGLETLRTNKKTIIWSDPSEHQVWAPELHQVDDKWYVYYAASDGENRNHRMYVLESGSPFGPYKMAHRIGDDYWGIDLTLFRHGTALYAAWSGWAGKDDEFPQHLYVAPMYGPWTMGSRVRVASPELPWEKSVAPINEGPQAISSPEGRLFLTYSANASWTQDYCVGMLELTGENPLDPTHWYKHPKPLLLNAGHGCFLESQNLYVYHRKQSTLEGWTDREICWSPFSWEDGNLTLSK